MFPVQRQTARSWERTSGKRSPERTHASAQPVLAAQRASCPCGGGCPACQAKSNALKLSKPNDPAEIEADSIADRVMRMANSETESAAKTQHSPGTIHRKCDACEDEEETIQRKPLLSGGVVPSQSPAHVQSAIGSGGRPLDPGTRSFFEPRLGYDLSSVRIHTGDTAGESARAIDAKAYTLGSNIVLGNDEYRPDTESGRYLLAHELAHVTQQNSHTLHRRLKVDAAASDDPATAISMMDPLITALCPDFQTDSTSGEITPRSGTPCAIPRFAAVAGGSHPLGCCCLCTMTRPWGSDWKIVVTSTGGPSTSEGEHKVRMTPTSGPNAPELQSWTAAGSVQTQPRVEAFGHELCGHAALMKIVAHPGDTADRAFSDEHDPTVRVQNALAVEMGIPGDRRGLAASGTHRGESLRVFAVGPFAADADNPSSFAAQIAAAVAFLNGKPELLFDIVGFKDAADTNAGISASRASRVRAEIVRGLAVADVTVETTPGVSETLTRAQPATDGGAGASRIVELRMAIRPAGLIAPPGATPPSPPVHVDPTNPARVAALKRGSVNQCHQLLANTAWP